MRKKNILHDSGKKFYFLLLIYLILAISDLSLTYLGTPDLKNEANPLITVFGLGWGALILANIIQYIVFFTFAYYTFVRYKRPIIQCMGIKQFVSILFFNRSDKFIWIFFKWPANKACWKNLVAPFGYTIVMTFIVNTLIVVIDWIIILSGNRLYMSIRTEIPSLIVNAFVIIVLFFCFFIYWFVKEYKFNKKNREMI